jgi:ParB-like chromosome segregation protein Spo0J
LPNYLTLPIPRLMPDPHNVRIHDEANLKAIQGSLKAFGQQKPIVIDQSYRVLAGNGTLEAAKRLGWKEIECVVSTLEDEAATAFALADNRTAELADWDMSHLGHQLQGLLDLGFDIGDIGFEPGWDKDELDKKPKKETEPKTKNEFLIILECRDEREQEALYHDLLEKGVACRLV